MWGKELALIYNEAALPIVAGQLIIIVSRKALLIAFFVVLGKHPEQLGQPVFSFWGELVEQGFEDMFDQVMIHGKSVSIENGYFKLKRAPQSSRASLDPSHLSHESDELRAREGYYNFSLLPVFDADGGIAGVLYEGLEVTSNVVAARRLSTLIRFEESGSGSQTMRDVWKTVMDGLEQNQQDAPFAFLYSGTGDPTAETMSQRLSLEGSIGLPVDHPIAKLHSPNASLASLIDKAWSSRKPTIVRCSDLRWQCEGTDTRRSSIELDIQSGASQAESVTLKEANDRSESPSILHVSADDPAFSDNLALGHLPFVIPGRGFGDEVTSALILPIPRLGGSEPIGVLVMGLNPQQTFDEPYQEWIRQLTESLVRLVSSISVPEELRRQQRAIQEMAREHARITSHLTGKKQEAEIAGLTLRRIADMAPVGMAMFEPDGRQIWVNQGYADHVRMRREDVDLETVKTNIHPDDKRVVDQAREGTASPLNELRILRGEPDPNFQPLPGDDGHNWILAAPQIMYDESGNVESVFGW